MKEDSHSGQADAAQQQAAGAEDQAAQGEVTCGGTEGDAAEVGGTAATWPTVALTAAAGSAVKVTETGSGLYVLDARDAHPGATLADLYDPDKMPADLRRAHADLDAAVEAAYGVDFNGDEEKIVAHLFNRYTELAADR